MIGVRHGAPRTPPRLKDRLCPAGFTATSIGISRSARGAGRHELRCPISDLPHAQGAALGARLRPPIVLIDCECNRDGHRLRVTLRDVACLNARRSQSRIVPIAPSHSVAETLEHGLIARHAVHLCLHPLDQCVHNAHGRRILRNQRVQRFERAALQIPHRLRRLRNVLLLCILLPPLHELHGVGNAVRVVAVVARLVRLVRRQQMKERLNCTVPLLVPERVEQPRLHARGVRWAVLCVQKVRHGLPHHVQFEQTPCQLVRVVERAARRRAARLRHLAHCVQRSGRAGIAHHLLHDAHWHHAALLRVVAGPEHADGLA